MLAIPTPQSKAAAPLPPVHRYAADTPVTPLNGVEGQDCPSEGTPEGEEEMRRTGPVAALTLVLAAVVGGLLAPQGATA